MKYSREKIKAVMDAKGYKYFTGDNYDVNIIGIIMNIIVQQTQVMIGPIILG